MGERFLAVGETKEPGDLGGAYRGYPKVVGRERIERDKRQRRKWRAK